jgi:hypothetical protein
MVKFFHSLRIVIVYETISKSDHILSFSFRFRRTIYLISISVAFHDQFEVNVDYLLLDLVG